MSDSKAAVLRAARTAIQMGVSAAAVWLLAKVPQLATWGLDETQVQAALWAVVTAAFSFVWRRWLDPSNVPSLVEQPPSSDGP